VESSLAGAAGRSEKVRPRLCWRLLPIIRVRLMRMQKNGHSFFPKEWPQETPGAGYPFGSQAIQ
jgi:hypothetical protein